MEQGLIMVYLGIAIAVGLSALVRYTQIDYVGGDTPMVRVCGKTILLPEGTQEDDIKIIR